MHFRMHQNFYALLKAQNAWKWLFFLLNSSFNSWSHWFNASSNLLLPFKIIDIEQLNFLISTCSCKALFPWKEGALRVNFMASTSVIVSSKLFHPCEWISLINCSFYDIPNKLINLLQFLWVKHSFSFSKGGNVARWLNLVLTVVLCITGISVLEHFHGKIRY